MHSLTHSTMRDLHLDFFLCNRISLFHFHSIDLRASIDHWFNCFAVRHCLVNIFIKFIHFHALYSLNCGLPREIWWWWWKKNREYLWIWERDRSNIKVILTISFVCVYRRQRREKKIKFLIDWKSYGTNILWWDERERLPWRHRIIPHTCCRSYNGRTSVYCM